MAKLMPRNRVLEAIIEEHIVRMLCNDNPHVALEIYANLKIIVHSVELVDDDVLDAQLEHYLVDDYGVPLCKPHFARVEITEVFPCPGFFNSEDDGIMYDGEPVNEQS